MFAAFLLFTREGLEAMLIVSILAAYLAAEGRLRELRYILLGTAAAISASALAGAALFLALRDAFVGSVAQEWFETAIFGLAALLLTVMTFWMRNHARHLAGHLRGRAKGASAPALVLLAFVTVGREALETSILLVALVAHHPAPGLAAGAIGGIVLAVAVSASVYGFGRKVNFGRLFNILGTGLLVVSAGLLANVVENLQDLRILPGREFALWNAQRFLSDSSTLGSLLHGVAGYTASPTFAQVLAWAAFLAVSSLLLWGKLPAPRGLARED